MTPQEKAKQEGLADKLRKMDPFSLDKVMVKDPEKLRENKSFPTIKVQNGEPYGTA